MEGRRVLNVSWDEGPNKDLNTAAIMASLKQAAHARRARTSMPPENPAKLPAATSPPNTFCLSWRTLPWSRATAPRIFRASKCELWAPTQVPQDCRDSVATAIGLDPDQVKVNVTLMGGGFGRRLEHDYAVEAAQVSKAINAPVKVIWTREDDMRCSTYRPASLHQLSATLDGRDFQSHSRIASSRPRSAGKKVSPFRTVSIPICPTKPARSTASRTTPSNT